MTMLESIDAYWLWLALGCLLLAVEVLIVPVGFFLCLGSAALAVALLVFLVPSLSWLWVVSIYAVLSVLSIAFWFAVLRKAQRAKAAGEHPDLNVKTRQLLGYKTQLTEDVKAGRGRVRVNDSAWPVEADKDYPAGTTVEVVEVRGITLIVKAVE